MESLLKKIEEEEEPGGIASGYNIINDNNTVSKDDISQAITRFAEALREAVSYLDIEESRDDDKSDDNNNKAVVNAKWLLRMCEKIPSELGSEYLARSVWEATKLTEEGQQQEALFAALGASEEAMEVMFEIAPQLPIIKRNIKLSELGDPSQQSSSAFSAPFAPEYMDEDEMNRQRLRQEAMDAAQVAYLARAEADALIGPSRAGTTHTILRSSEKEAQKVAKKAEKRAAQAMQRAKAAGAIIEESELLAMDQSMMGSGGLIGRSSDELLAIQQSLQPEGTRVYQQEKALPKGTYAEDYEECEKVIIPVPALDKAKLHERFKISDVIPDPDCARAFAGTTSLNPMQSTVYDTAFNKRYNMLVCAPTGAGKTNVAMLTLTAHFRDVGLIGGGSGERTTIDTGSKVVYIAPMKALAQEVVEKFSSKLKPLGLIVREFTGDMQLTRAEAQSANVLVTTPEKWDVVTRKSGNDENSLGNQCGLLIIDEVHLLADERGAVIESVVSRLHRLVETRQTQLRIVGLSATLPNYEDVAEFLHVPKQGLFYFGPEYRPVPLQQTFIGVKGSIRDRKLIEDRMNDSCYEIVKDSLARGYQVMVFIHSRKGTGDTATVLAKLATEAEELDRYFVTQGKEGPPGVAYAKFADRAKKSRNRELTQHFYNGMGIHHAGMLRGDRKLTESMFAEGAIKVLCCTATLAWGINLPAHTVVIKGTDVYNPEKGKNIDLSILDVQQIFGRAGRPQFDTSGEANLITNHAALTRYLDKLVRAVPIESTFVKQLADHMNAEIVGGTVTNVGEAATWLSYTYLYVRMIKNPLAYGITSDKKADDPMLRGHCLELVKNAAEDLAMFKMVSYDPGSGNLGMTTLGRVAAHFYIQAETVANFTEAIHLNPELNDKEILRLVASATEFSNVRVRQEEQQELDDLQKECPVPLEGPVHDSVTKVYVLIQAFITRKRPRSFTLISDVNYIASNAGRVARAIFEMCIHSNLSGAALKLLRLAKSIDNQIWWFQSPLRMFEAEIGMRPIIAIETSLNRKGYDSFGWTVSLLDMSVDEVGQLCKSKKEVAKKIQRFTGMIPRPDLSCSVLPVTSEILRFQVGMVPNFEWHGRWHGGIEQFWLWVEDAQSGRIYHHEQVLFKKATYPDPINIDIHIPALSSSSSQYILRIVSDSWVGVEFVYPVSLKETTLPKQTNPHTNLIDLTPLPTTALQNENYEKLFSKIETFNPVQTQLFHVLYHTNSPVLLGAPTGSGKTIVAELALLRMKRIHKDGICVYIAPLKSLARERLNEWRERFGSSAMKWKVLELSGDTSHDRRALESADILVCTPEKWDLISRSWSGKSSGTKDQAQKRSFVKRVRLLVIDEIHLLGEERGAVLEAIVSRTRFISQQIRQERLSECTGSTESNHDGTTDIVRIVGLSTAVANPLDMASWIGIDIDGSSGFPQRGLYNFRPSIRPVETKVHVQGYPGKHYCPRMATMNKPCYAAIKQHAPDRPTLIFVASRRQTRLTAFDIISYAARDENPKCFLGCDEALIEAMADTIQDESLRHTLSFGIGLHHAGLSTADRATVEKLFLNQQIRVLVATATLAWGVNLPARLVIVKGTEFFDGKTSRYVDYPITDILQMIGRAGRPGFDTEGRAVVMVESSKKNFYKKFLYSPLPVESCLNDRLCEILNAEIAAGSIKSFIDSVGYLSWTFFARRVKSNPNFYGAKSSDDADVAALFDSVAKDTLLKLRNQECIECNKEFLGGGDIVPSTLGHASSEFYLRYETPKQILLGLVECGKMIRGKTNSAQNEMQLGSGSSVSELPFSNSSEDSESAVAWLFYTIACTHEFDELPVRHNEEILNEELSDGLMWGPDAQTRPSRNDSSSYVNPEVYGDPHTKCFLLIQAWIERSRLPISDYVNDTKSAVDNLPRLLAAMQYILVNSGTIEYAFEVLCHLLKARQIFLCRSTMRQNPIRQLPGKMADHTKSLLRAVGKVDSEVDLLWHLRRMEKGKLLEVLRNSNKGKKNLPVQQISDALHQIPKFSLRSSKVAHTMDKASGKSRGKLSIVIELERANKNKGRKSWGGNDDGYATLSVVIGSFEQRNLLAYSEISVARSGSWSVSKDIEFDWDLAQTDGGEGSGSIIVRLQLDAIRGMDSEIVISLV